MRISVSGCCLVVIAGLLLRTGLLIPASAQNIPASVRQPGFQVKWIQEISDSTLWHKPGIFEKVSDLILGKNEANRMQRPFSVYANNSDSIFILDQQSGTVFLLHDQELQVPKALKNKGINFTSLIEMCRIGGDTLLFTDSHLKNLYYLSPDLRTMEAWHPEVQLNQPTGIARAKSGNRIWVCETASHQIRVMDTKGNTVKIIGKRGNAPGEFNFPTDIWIDARGIAYVIDAMNFRIQMFDAEGKYINGFGEAGDGSGYLARPKGIATDSYGHIYITDALFHTVQVFDTAGQFLYQFGNQGRAKGEFWMPAGIFVDASDKIYIADSFNARIQVFQLIPDS